jgi:hypothetical protein
LRAATGGCDSNQAAPMHRQSKTNRKRLGTVEVNFKELWSIAFGSCRPRHCALNLVSTPLLLDWAQLFLPVNEPQSNIVAGLVDKGL